MTKPLVLIVDDTAENIQVLGKILKGLSCNIAVAKEGKTALSIAKSKVPDLILLDVMMPGMSGFEVCQELKFDKVTKDIPVIFLTALSDTKDIIKGFRLGAVDYVVKPFIPEELLARVTTHLSMSQDRNTIVEQKTKLQNLIHMLCHDIGNPTHAIITVLELLKQNQLELEESVELIDESAQRTVNLLDVIKQFMAVKSKGLDTSIVDLSMSVGEAVKGVRFRLDEKEMDIIVNMEENIHVWAEEATLIHSVLVNIFTNAIKFSKNSSNIWVECIDNTSNTELIIRDKGVGIPVNILDKLFDVDACTSRSGTAGETGTGFGMPLVKQLMATYGGELKVLSSINEPSGTEVHLIFRKHNHE
ncbi:MAG: response regulator [Candidatus Cloacimonetes bacterium]|nr:response regulator [Candidatus Cloacimonadota bacterium]